MPSLLQADPELAQRVFSAQDGSGLPRELVGHQPRTGATFYGFGAIIFALPFIAAGLAMMNFGDFILAWVGGIFSFAGASVMLSGVVGGLRRGHIKRMRAEYPTEPWQWDHRWNMEGCRDDTLSRAMKGIYTTIFIGLFLVPFNLIATHATPRFLWISVVCFFDLILLACLFYCLYLIARVMKYGSTQLRFNRFPYMLGETMSAQIINTAGARAFSSITFTLRCIQVFQRRSGGNTRQACLLLHTDTRTLRADAPGMLDRPTFEISFELPTGDFGTRLSDPMPRYWELEVAADAPGVDFGACFLLPVYGRGVDPSA